MFSRRAVIGSAAALSVSPAFGKKQDPIAMTSAGPVRGVRKDGVHIFKGIRYGADTAAQRFEKPLPPAPWTEVADAFDYGPASPQSGKDEAQSEDCLFLNVWTPGVNEGGKRAVMVYIHGGAYNSGSGSSALYDGGRLAAKGDVVVITVNHRLNAFGYLYLPALFPDSGNAGSWDLILALEWVKANATAFGGDPSRVMVFGQSGGGAKIATMMAAPAAKGLFHAAATMSGQQITASGPLNATARAKAFLDALKVSPSDAVVLKSLPAERIVEALKTRDAIDPSREIYFGPVLDEHFLTRHPFYPDAPVQSAAIPMIIGNTHDETRNLIGRSEPDSFSLTWEMLPKRLAKHMRVDISPEAVITEYKRLYPDYSASDVFFAATTAGRSWRAAWMEVELRAVQGAPTWTYQVDFVSPLDGGKWGAPHTIDIALAFDNTDAKGSLTGNGRDARKVADKLSSAFIALAKTGDPNHDGLPQWSQYSLAKRETMIVNRKCRLENDPRGGERELFSKVPFIQWGT